MRKIDLTGQRFGRYVVIHEVEKRGHQRYYKCRCDCGNVKEVSQSNLKRGISKSCGCLRNEMRSIDIQGKRFGLLTALRSLGTQNRRTIWEVKCDCGNIKQLPYTSIVFGVTQSCGCLKRQTIQKMEQGRSNLIVDGVHTYALTKKIDSRSKTGIKGVSKYFTRKGEVRYRAYIKVKGVPYNLGTFKALEEAIDARHKGEEVYHLPFIQKLQEKPPTT